MRPAASSYYDFFEFLTENRPASDCEVLILEGLFAWHEAQQQSAFVAPGGTESFADLTLIDTGLKHESWNTQPVQVFYPCKCSVRKSALVRSCRPRASRRIAGRRIRPDLDLRRLFVKFGGELFLV